MSTIPFARLFPFMLVALLWTAVAKGDVIINEIMAAASDRLLQTDTAGVPQVGTGDRWYQASYNDSLWQTGNGPFGYGIITNAPAPISTNLQSAVQYLTPTTYLRKSFDVTAGDAARTEQVQLVVDYNDGFVAFLNGVEVARRNGGPVKKWMYHDQPAYNREVFSNTTPIPTTATSETINLGAASTLLNAGNNILAIHLLNASATDATYYLKADLRINATPVVNLVTYNQPWKYFPGLVEPSGNLFDPAQLGSGKLHIPWGSATYNDATWLSGAGPFGFGGVGTIGTNVQAALLNRTPSLYQRFVFTASPSQAADSLPLKLIVSYDDGFVAYLNGVEVARRRIGVPNTFTPRDAVADGDISVQTDTIVLDGASKLLVTGSNVLAVQTHNFSASNSDFLSKVDLQTNASVPLVTNNAAWKYLPGTTDPTPEISEDEEDSSPEGPDANADWIELYNNGPTAVSLNGWKLSDDATNNAKWVFPDVNIPPGGYLVLVADGADLKTNAGGFLHTNFALDRDGEFLALYDQAGVSVSQIAPKFPVQVAFYSYARAPNGAWNYSDRATPGAANAGNTFTGRVAAPTANIAGRFYSSSQTVTFTSSTPGAVVRYTVNGQEPTSVSPMASGAIPIGSSTILRARAFLEGWIPSDTVTNTYLVNQSAARRSLPAVCLGGDEQQTFYRPFGIFAIQGGGYWSGGTAGPPSTTGFNGVWHNFTGNTAPASTAANLTPFYPVPSVPADPLAYNAPMQSGKPAERPTTVEILHTDSTADLRDASFLRCAGSPHGRTRFQLLNQNSTTPNSASPWTINIENKPQINLFFRDDIGSSPVKYPLIPDSPIASYKNIRLRAGKNDIGNPFIRDEFSRRCFIDMGQVTVLGDFCNLYVNAVFKGYYNICQRPREPYFQEARGSSKSFDVRNITTIADGDILSYNELLSFARTHNMAVATDYTAMKTRLDVVNLADYVLFNAHAAMADWPGNNYVMDRERSASGLWRFSVWDGEGGYGGFSRNPAYKIFNDINTTNIAGESVPTKLLYSVLKQSPEFRMLCADRIQRHFFNNGALTDSRLTTRFNLLATRIQPIMTEVLNQTVSPFLNIWLNGQGDGTRYTLSGVTTGTIVNAPRRRTALFEGYYDDTAGGSFVPGFFAAESLWPATVAPSFGVFGGNVPQNYPLSMVNPNSSGTILYTTNGNDPRSVGGGVQGTAYSTPITINQTTLVRARVLSASGEWSPLMEAIFTTPTPAPVIISEIMYHPAKQGTIDGDEFEFLELKNVGSAAVALSGMHFTDGITFSFPSGSTLAPGAFCVLAKNPTQFATRYPGIAVLGSYGPSTSLSNGGETITLRDLNEAIVFSVTYSDLPPWPAGTDGDGRSLVPVNPNSFTDTDDPAQWRASRDPNGSPGANDPFLFPLVVINELLANPAPGQSDAVELFNPSAETANVSFWWLSNTVGTPKKYQIPAGTTIPAGGFLVVREEQFNTTPGVGNSFEFSRTGADVVLSSGGPDGSLTGYSHAFPAFGASPAGVSFGPYRDSTNTERFLLQSAVTLGGPNSGPRVGPVVITELMYNFPGRSDFIELCNISNEAVPMFDTANPANTWKVGGIEFVFPQNITLQPHQMVIIYGPTFSNPNSIYTRYNIPSAVTSYGSLLGNLQNIGGELVSISMPAAPVPGQALSYIEIDSVKYNNVAPWPTGSGSPNGSGPSLERINWRSYGNDVVNWRSSGNSGGTPGVLSPVTFAGWQNVYFTAAQRNNPNFGGSTADPDADGLTNFWEFATGGDPMVADATGKMSSDLLFDAGAGPYLTMRYRRNLGATGLVFACGYGRRSGRMGTRRIAECRCANKQWRWHGDDHAPRYIEPQ